jgi:hypothetical protein
MYREKAIAVSPALNRYEAGSAAEFLEFGDPVFARILGVDGFTRAQFEPLPAYCHALRFETHQMHLRWNYLEPQDRPLEVPPAIVVEARKRMLSCYTESVMR